MFAELNLYLYLQLWSYLIVFPLNYNLYYKKRKE
nr:MAG TPA: hypothetical protein [Caudoviricetes sp.]